MSRLLSELLQAREPAFTLMLRELEAASGRPTTDLHLTSEIISKTKRKLRELGLDPFDTSGKELYHGLRLLAQTHDQFLRKLINASKDEPLNNLQPKLLKALAKLSVPKSTWALKASTIKKLLKNQPPRQIMKQLGYKSVDSLLKRENAHELLTATTFAQSPLWQKRFVRAYRRLNSSDFETRAIKIFIFDKKRWDKAGADYIRRYHHNLVPSFEGGAIGLLPMPVQQLNGFCLAIMALALHFINEIRLHGAYFKFQQMRPDFGEVLMRTILNESQRFASLGRQPIHWRTIQRHFGSRDAKLHPGVFEPHLAAEDISWRTAGDGLYQLEPALQFWQGHDFVGAMHDDRPLSLNVIDVVADYCNDVPYERRTWTHLQPSLWNELYARYLAHDNFEQALIAQLDETSVDAWFAPLQRQERAL